MISADELRDKLKHQAPTLWSELGEKAAAWTVPVQRRLEKHRRDS
jgi:hypothetical protein